MRGTKELYQLFIQHPRISTDSRKIEKDSLFFALKGENFNGNKFAIDAIKKGAAYAIIDENEFATSDKCILVDDVLLTLSKLANHHRNTLNIPILAITGTNGKTTTKELTAAVLSQKFKVSFTEGNLNNHIGVPLTLLRMNRETEFGIVEMGANHPGEIEHLCKIANPDYGIITNIGKAHLEGFGSFEGVIKTKSELFNYIREKKGKFFYNQDNPILEGIAAAYENKLTFGKEQAGFNGELLNSPPFVNVKAAFQKGILYLNSNLIGDYNYENIMAAACIGNHFNVDPLKIQKALKEYFPKNNRSQLIKTTNYKIIMDAYNANPTSMKASITSFLRGNTSSTILILGDMLELGEYTDVEHKKILEILKELDTQKVFVVGKHFSKVSHDFDVTSFEKVDELKQYLQNHPIKNGNILIKGSRGIQLEKVLDLFS